MITEALSPHAPTPKINGNSLVKIPHLFVPGEGTYFPSLEIAMSQGDHKTGVGLWTKQREYAGKLYFQVGNTNVWD